MFRKSRRQKDEDSKRQFLADIQQACDAANACPDIAERYLKLVEARERVEKADAVLRQNIRVEASDKGQTMFLGTFGTGSAVGVLAILGLHFPPLFVLAGPALGFYYGKRAGHDVANTAQEKGLRENQAFFEALSAKRTGITQMTAEIERTQLPELAASPKCEEIVKKAPALREMFAAAFGRQAAAEKERKSHPKPDGFKL